VRSLIAARPSRRELGLVAAAILVAISAGGVWQVRSLVNYGSPLAPTGLRVAGHTIFPGSTVAETSHYLSELDEIEHDGGRRAWLFARQFIRRWVGGWFLWLAWPMAVFSLDAVVARRGAAARFADRRLAFAAYVFVSGAVLAVLVTHAPWSGLRWTGGLALRYVLPVIVLIMFTAVLAIFPLTWRWFERPRAFAGGSALLGLGVAWLGVATLQPSTADASAALVDVTPATAIAAACLVAGWLAVRTRSRRWLAGSLATAVALAAVGGGSLLAARDSRLRPAARARLPAPIGCGVDPAADTTHPYAAILRAESIGRRTCTTRRVFVTTRYDTPLDLQGAPYDTIVLQASTATLVDREVRLRGPGATGCDYVIANAAELATTRGVPLLTRLRGTRIVDPVGDAGPLRLFHVRPAETVTDPRVR
jgi:hypothetical protein